MMLIPEEKLQQAAIKHYEYFKTKRLPTLTEEAAKTSLKYPEKVFLRFLLRVHKIMIIGKPDKINKIIKIIAKLEIKHPILRLRLKQKKSKLCKIIKKVFDYNSFSQSSPPDWGAYEFCKKLEVDTCPYCNKQYISLLYTNSKESKTRPELDHFFDKATYPYLALSLYNLIPCCKVCNSSFKGRKKFTLQKNIHPYVEEFGNDITFSIEFAKKSNSAKDWDLSLYYDGDKANFKVVLKENKNADKTLLKRAKENAKIFKIAETYDFHKDVAFELIQKSIVYNDEMIADIYNRYPNLFINKEDVRKMVIGNYLNESNLNKRPFAKFMNDISKELGLKGVVAYP